jgi:type IV secretory pathway VirJ component
MLDIVYKIQKEAYMEAFKKVNKKAREAIKKAREKAQKAREKARKELILFIKKLINHYPKLDLSKTLRLAGLTKKDYNAALVAKKPKVSPKSKK